MIVVQGGGGCIHLDDKPLQHVDGLYTIPRGLEQVSDAHSTLGSTCQAKQQRWTTSSIMSKSGIMFSYSHCTRAMGALDDDAQLSKRFWMHRR